MGSWHVLPFINRNGIIIYHTFSCFEGSSKQRSQNRFVGSVVTPFRRLVPRLRFPSKEYRVDAALCISPSQLRVFHRGPDVICFFLEQNMCTISLLVLKD